jgi:hypothetical protein
MEGDNKVIIKGQDATQVCTPSICVEKWKAVHDKLDTMHADFADLRRIVTNGLQDRIKQIEVERQMEKEESKRFRQHVSRWEVAVISIVVLAVSSGVLTVAKQYFDSATARTRQLIRQEGFQP